MRTQNCGGLKSGFLSKLRVRSGSGIFLLVQILFQDITASRACTNIKAHNKQHGGMKKLPNVISVDLLSRCGQLSILRGLEHHLHLATVFENTHKEQ